MRLRPTPPAFELSKKITVVIRTWSRTVGNARTSAMLRTFVEAINIFVTLCGGRLAA